MTESNLKTHRLHKLPPPGRPYILGRFHPDRFSLRGYMIELRVYLTALGGQGRGRKFLVLGGPRSGSTLLTRMLDQLENIGCDPEMLHFAVMFPALMLNRLAVKSNFAAYGCKLLTYQILEVQNFKDCRPFLRNLSKSGFVFLHIRRDVFDQALSLCVSFKSGTYMSKKGQEGKGRPREFWIDPDEFRKVVRWCVASLDYEKQMLTGLPHLVVDYESDLKAKASHQGTIDRICSFLNVPSGPVKSDTARTGGAKGLYQVENKRELRQIFQEMELASHGNED